MRVCMCVHVRALSMSWSWVCCYFCGMHMRCTCGDGDRLDGSEHNHTRDAIDAYLSVCGNRRSDVHYMNERDADVIAYMKSVYAHAPNRVIKNDQSLRSVVHHKIRLLYGHGRWIMLCHPDEFFYHNPKQVNELWLNNTTRVPLRGV